MRLENFKDDVLFARTGHVVHAQTLRHLNQLADGFELERGEIHRLARRGQFGGGNNTYIIVIEKIVLRQTFGLIAAMPLAITAAFTWWAIAITATAAIT